MAGWLDDIFNGAQFKGQDPKGLLEMLSQLAQTQAGPSAGFPPAGPPQMSAAGGGPMMPLPLAPAPDLPPPKDIAGLPQPPANLPVNPNFPPDAQASAEPPTGAVSPAAAMAPPPGAAPFFPGQDVLARVGHHVLQTLHDNSNSMIAGGGAMISGGLGHGLSAMAAAAPIDIAARKERQGNEAIQATYEAVLRQQLARGVPMADARATALGASQNAELLKTVVGPQYQHVTVKGLMGDERVGAFDPRTGQVTFGGQAGSAPGSVMEGLIPNGQEYLDKFVPKELHNSVRAMANYDAPTSGMGSLKQLLPHVLNYDPTFDQTNFSAKVALKKAYQGGGKNFQELQSFQTVSNHMGELVEAAKALDPSDWKIANNIRNLSSDYIKDNPALVRFRNALNTVNHELGNAYHGGHITDSSLHAFQQSIADNMSTPGLKAAIGEMAGLLHGKITANEDSFNAALPGDKGPKEFKALSAKTAAAYQHIKEWAKDIKPTEGVKRNEDGSVSLPGGVTIRRVQ